MFFITGNRGLRNRRRKELALEDRNVKRREGEKGMGEREKEKE